MSQPKITTPGAPTVQVEIKIQGMIGGKLAIHGTGNLDLDLDLVLAAALSLQQERKRQDKPLIEPVSLGKPALDLLNGGRAK